MNENAVAVDEGCEFMMEDASTNLSNGSASGVFFNSNSWSNMPSSAQRQCSTPSSYPVRTLAQYAPKS